MEAQEAAAEAPAPSVLPVPDPLSDEEKGRLSTARRLLHEAAAAAKGVEEAGSDLDKASNQAWLYAQLMNLVALEDIDPKSSLPASFNEYLHRK
jgi:hypothetical protein